MTTPKNPIAARMDDLGLSQHAVAKILEITQTNIHKHYHGTRRLSADSMEMYNLRLGIPMKELRAWNKHLKEKKIQENKNKKTDNSKENDYATSK